MLPRGSFLLLGRDLFNDLGADLNFARAFWNGDPFIVLGVCEAYRRLEECSWDLNLLEVAKPKRELLERQEFMLFLDPL